MALGALLTAGVALASCAAMASSSAPPSNAAPTTTAPTASTAARTVAAREQPGWSVVSELHGVILADRRTFHEPDGNVVTVYRFHAATVTYALHTGSEDPPGVAGAVGPANGPAIAPSELHRVIAAFNGGFKVASGSGGFEVAHRVFVPLRPGVASLVIDANGRAHVGTWGSRLLPAPGERVVAVRQNLQPLIANGRVSPLIGDLAAWGVTLGGIPNPARSAVGQDRRGDILFAGSMQALPPDMAHALLAAGAVRAMEMDINPYWVQLDSTPHPGGTLVAGIPNQQRPGDQYVIGWTRDFFTVLVR